MQIVLAAAEVVLLLIGACLALLNWTALYVSYRNRQRGIDRYVSGTPGVPQIAVLLSAAVAHWVQVIHVPSWVFWLIALADTTTFMILGLPAFLLRRLRKQT